MDGVGRNIDADHLATQGPRRVQGKTLPPGWVIFKTLGAPMPGDVENLVDYQHLAKRT